jgi:hypothetical protein
VYKLQAENRKRTDEVRELQKVSSLVLCPPAAVAAQLTTSCMSPAQALSDAHTYLFEERERLLALQAENDTLRLQGDPSSPAQAPPRRRSAQPAGLACTAPLPLLQRWRTGLASSSCCR